MSETLIYGICDSCEKKYRVPSADKHYPCKACGGTVAVHEVEEHRSASERFNARRKKDRGSAPIWIGMVVILLLTGGGLLGYQLGAFGTVFGAGVDGRLFDPQISQVDAAFADAWNAGDKEALVLMHHPTGREEFALRLNLIGEHRAWGATWPALDRHQGSLQGGTELAPEKAGTSAVCGENSIDARWQYDSNVGRWFIYKFWITPTPLIEQVEAFRAAWATSDTEALKPFFGEKSALERVELFDKQLAKAGWTGAHPKLGAVELTGEESALSPLGAWLGGKVESVFERDGGDVLFRWRFDQEDDVWQVTGLRF